MANQTQTPTARPDVDIHEDLQRLLTTASYAPLMHDRHKVQLTVHDGVVQVQGHVKVSTTRRFLLGHLERIAGVRQVVVDHFYDDESIRREVARITAGTLQIMVDYGVVILAGTLPDGVTAETLAAQVSAIPGVTHVVTTF